MLAAPIPINEDARIASLRSMHLIGTPREPDLDRITRLAQQHFGVETALVSLMDSNRQWFKSRCGMTAIEAARETSFCGHALLQQDALVIPDATQDERFADNPVVAIEGGVRFYAGQSLENSAGFRIGTLCLVSPQPRQFTQLDRAALADFARLAEMVFDNRALGENQVLLLESLATAEREKMIDPLSGLWNRRGLEAFIEHELARAKRVKGSMTLGMIDVDHFKQVNDTFGHDVGDQAIQLVASLLVSALRTTDVVGRLGGDEFAVLLTDASPELIPRIGDRIMEEFRNHGDLAACGGKGHLQVSVGFASGEHYSSTCVGSQSLLAEADRALYESKRSGRNRYMVHSI